MSNINKDCWIKNTSFKIFGITIFEKVEQCDQSTFEKPESSAFYSVPKCFQPKD